MKNNDYSSEEPQGSLYFWLGEEGEAIVVTEEEFKQKQKDWDGERPAS